MSTERSPSACLVISIPFMGMLQPEKRSNAWVKSRLPDVVAALNNAVTRLSGKKKLAVAIKAKVVSSKSSTPYSRPVGVNEDNFHPT